MRGLLRGSGLNKVQSTTHCRPAVWRCRVCDTVSPRSSRRAEPPKKTSEGAGPAPRHLWHRVVCHQRRLFVSRNRLDTPATERTTDRTGPASRQPSDPSVRVHETSKLSHRKRPPGSYSRMVARALPATYCAGLSFVYQHNKQGHQTWFRGETYDDGRPAYFPTLLAIKTPVLVLGLALVGLGFALSDAVRRKTLSTDLGWSRSARRSRSFCCY